MKLITRSLLAILGSTSALSAATFFTEDFSSETAGSNMALGTNPSGATTSFVGATPGDSIGDFKITSGTGSRIYLGTLGTDYNTVDFVFQATVTVSNTNAWGIAFFGMGSTTPNASASYEPGGTNLLMAVRNDGATPYLEGRDNGAGVSTNLGNIPGIVGGTHLLKMTWTAATKSAFFQFDTGNNGTIDGSFTLNGADNGFTGSNSQLVLGGGNGLVFDNVSVTAVPEPSTYGLIGAGALAGIAMVRRRRKHAGMVA